MRASDFVFPLAPLNFFTFKVMQTGHCRILQKNGAANAALCSCRFIGAFLVVEPFSDFFRS